MYAIFEYDKCDKNVIDDLDNYLSNNYERIVSFFDKDLVVTDEIIMPNPVERIIICKIQSGTNNSMGVKERLDSPWIRKNNQKPKNIKNCIPNEIKLEKAVATGDTSLG